MYSQNKHITHYVQPDVYAHIDIRINTNTWILCGEKQREGETGRGRERERERERDRGRARRRKPPAMARGRVRKRDRKKAMARGITHNPQVSDRLQVPPPMSSMNPGPRFVPLSRVDHRDYRTERGTSFWRPGQRPRGLVRHYPTRRRIS